MQKLSAVAPTCNPAASETTHVEPPASESPRMVPDLFFMLVRERYENAWDGFQTVARIIGRRSLADAEATADGMNRAIAVRGDAAIERVVICAYAVSTTHRVTCTRPDGSASWHFDVCSLDMAEQVKKLQLALVCDLVIEIDEVAACPVEGGALVRRAARRGQKTTPVRSKGDAPSASGNTPCSRPTLGGGR
jgi:hypothetical protein